MPSFPHTFASLGGSEPASYLDDNFAVCAFASDVSALTATVAALPGTATPLKPVAGGSAGAAVTLSKVDHQHPPQSAAPNTQTGTSYTLVPGDDGVVVEFSNGSAITATLPNNAAVGFSCLLVQVAAGQVTFVAAGGASLRQASSLTKTRAQWSVVTAYVRTNAGGSAAEWVLAGDMA